MTELTVKHDPATGIAVIEIRGADIGQTRFRLRDPYTEKCLTKRGWTKTMSFLPGEAKSVDGVTRITLDADLARKLTPGINLILEQPVADFEEIFTWPSPNAPVIDLLAEMPEEADEAADVIPVADVPAEKTEEPAEPQPASPLLEPFVPTVIHDQAREQAEPANEAHSEFTPTGRFDSDKPASRWRPALIAALLFFVLGLGVGTFWLGSNSAELKQTRQAAAAQLEKQKSEFDRQLKEAQAQAASAAAAATKASETKAADLASKSEKLTTERDTARKALASKEKSLAALQQQLDDANAQIDAVKNAAGDEARAQIDVLDKKIATLTADLNKANTALTTRATDAELAAIDKPDPDTATDAAKDPVPGQADATSPENSSQMQQERDLYASELKTMTGNFTALQTEKAELEKTVADLKSQLKDAGVATTAETASNAIWGATAIDQSGSIYSLQNQTDEKLAQVGVIAKCRNKSGSRCEPLASYNNACLSVARIKGQKPTPENYAYFIHKSWKTASQTALERCESMGTACTVRFIACSPDGLSRPAPN